MAIFLAIIRSQSLITLDHTVPIQKPYIYKVTSFLQVKKRKKKNRRKKVTSKPQD